MWVGKDPDASLQPIGLHLTATEFRSLSSWTWQAPCSKRPANPGLSPEGGTVQPHSWGATVKAPRRLGLFSLREAAAQCLSEPLKVQVFKGLTALSAAAAKGRGGGTSCSTVSPPPAQPHSLVTTAVCREPQLAWTASASWGRSSNAGKGWRAMKGAGAPSSALAVLLPSEPPSFSPLASQKQQE